MLGRAAVFGVQPLNVERRILPTEDSDRSNRINRTISHNWNGRRHTINQSFVDFLECWTNLIGARRQLESRIFKVFKLPILEMLDSATVWTAKCSVGCMMQSFSHCHYHQTNERRFDNQSKIRLRASCARSPAITVRPISAVRTADRPKPIARQIGKQCWFKLNGKWIR